MLHDSIKQILKPTMLALGVALSVSVSAEEAIQIPGLNMPVAASQATEKASVTPEAAPLAKPENATELPSKARMVSVSHGQTDLPPVPASVVQPRAPSVPVDTRQDVIVSSGTNTLIPISINQINRLVTPFEVPNIQTVSNADISRKGNVIYVTTNSDQPVTMFITPDDDESVAISLTLLPQAIPPIQANLILGQSLPGAVASGATPTRANAYSGQARKWERSQPYMDTIRELMRDLALGKLPRGYSFGSLNSGDKIPSCLQPGLTFDFSRSQLILGHDLRVYVAVAENNSARTIEFDYGACTHPNRAAVASWPDEVLEPGQKTEVYMVTRIPTVIPDSSTRPSLLK